MKEKIVYILILLCLGTLVTKAQKKLSLKESMATGLRNSEQMGIVEERVNWARMRNNDVTAGLYPQVVLNASQNNRLITDNDPTSFVSGFYTNNNLQLNVNASYTLFDGYTVNRNKKRLGKEVQQQLMNQAELENSLVRSIVRNYLRVMMEEERIKLVKEVLTLSKEKFKEEYGKYKLGVVSKFSVMQFEFALKSDSVNLITQKQSLNRALLDWHQSMFVEGKDQYSPFGQVSTDFSDLEVERLKDKMIQQNPQLQNARINLELLRNELTRFDYDQYPRISVNTGSNAALSRTNFRNFDPIGGSDLNFYLSFNLRMNLYDWGLRKQERQGVAIEERIGRVMVDDVERRLTQQFDELIAQLMQYRELIAFQDRLIRIAKRQLSLADDRIKNGVSDFTEYRNTQLEYIRAMQTRLDLIFQYQLTEVDLYWLVGDIDGFAKRID